MMKHHLDNNIQPETELLQELLTAASSVRDQRLRPVALESLEKHRQRALSGYLLRNWFDAVLAHAERVLVVCGIGFFGWWFATGYGYDLVHALQNPPQPSAVAAQIPATPSPTATPLPHPELGSSLPVVAEPWQRPVVEADYLQPARPYVAPLPPTPTPVPQAPAPTAIIDKRPTFIHAPTIGLSSSIVEVFLQPTGWQVADYAVGYLHGTGSVGHGNAVLAGHKGIRGSVFKDIESLKSGDDIWVDSAQARFHYRVQTTYRVWPTQIDIMYPTADSVLTMMTCTNWDTQRFVVRAVLVDSAPLPAGN